MMLKKLLSLSLFLVLFFVVDAQTSKQEAYIERYKKIAISEMERAGVPASIKLAQGILESGSGKSTLARKANNHFGMKCGSAWTGKEYYKEDDDYDENGKLIKSCFRVFGSAKECYIAHSNFLKDPRKRYRYGFLFDLDIKNYEAWARGLKKAGYATSPTYADKLISVIESYNLDRYDSMTPDEPGDTPILAQKGIIKVNRIDVALAQEGESAFDIGLSHEVPTKCIVKYNEGITNATQSLKKDTRVFLKRKRNGYRGKRKYHVVKEGESMYDISQEYGVSLKKLRKRNRVSSDEEPAKRQKIKLRGFKVSNKNKPKVVAKSIEGEFEDEVDDKKDDEIDFSDDKVIDTDDPEDFDTFEDEVTPEEEIEIENSPTYHVVLRGETLYGVARRYKTTVDAIMALNNMDSSTISIGQQLRVK